MAWKKGWTHSRKADRKGMMKGRGKGERGEEERQGGTECERGDERKLGSNGEQYLTSNGAWWMESTGTGQSSEHS